MENDKQDLAAQVVEAGGILDNESMGALDVPAVLAALERARVVGTLDAWAEKLEGNSVNLYRAHKDWELELDNGRDVQASYRGVTPDAARAAAAKAIESGEV